MASPTGYMRSQSNNVQHLLLILVILRGFCWFRSPGFPAIWPLSIYLRPIYGFCLVPFRVYFEQMMGRLSLGMEPHKPRIHEYNSQVPCSKFPNISPSPPVRPQNSSPGCIMPAPRPAPHPWPATHKLRGLGEKVFQEAQTRSCWCLFCVCALRSSSVSSSFPYSSLTHPLLAPARPYLTRAHPLLVQPFSTIVHYFALLPVFSITSIETPEIFIGARRRLRWRTLGRGMRSTWPFSTSALSHLNECKPQRCSSILLCLIPI